MDPILSSNNSSVRTHNHKIFFIDSTHDSCTTYSDSRIFIIKLLAGMSSFNGSPLILTHNSLRSVVMVLEALFLPFSSSKIRYSLYSYDDLVPVLGSYNTTIPSNKLFLHSIHHIMFSSSIYKPSILPYDSCLCFSILNQLSFYAL